MLHNSRDISLASQCQRIPALNSDWFIVVFPLFTPVVVLVRFVIGSLDFSCASHRLRVLADWFILHATSAVISLVDVS